MLKNTPVKNRILFRHGRCIVLLLYEKICLQQIFSGSDQRSTKHEPSLRIFQNFNNNFSPLQKTLFMFFCLFKIPHQKKRFVVGAIFLIYLYKCLKNVII